MVVALVLPQGQPSTGFKILAPFSARSLVHDELEHTATVAGVATVAVRTDVKQSAVHKGTPASWMTAAECRAETSTDANPLDSERKVGCSIVDWKRKRCQICVATHARTNGIPTE